MSVHQPQPTLPSWARLRSLHTDESGVISLLTVFVMKSGLLPYRQ